MDRGVDVRSLHCRMSVWACACVCPCLCLCLCNCNCSTRVGVGVDLPLDKRQDDGLARFHQNSEAGCAHIGALAWRGRRIPARNCRVRFFKLCVQSCRLCRARGLRILAQTSCGGLDRFVRVERFKKRFAGLEGRNGTCDLFKNFGPLCLQVVDARKQFSTATTESYPHGVGVSFRCLHTCLWF